MAMNYDEMEQEIRSLHEKVTIYEEMVKETRRAEDRAKHSENRLLSTVHWTLGTAITVTLLAIFAVAGLNWWINEKVYTRDKQAFHEELVKLVNDKGRALTRDHEEAMKRQFEDLKKNLVREQNASYAQALIQLADLRQSLLDLEGALMNALVAFPKAQASGSEEERAALERMDLAIRRATMGQIRLPNQLIWAVQKIVSPGDRLSPLSHEKAIKLQETLEAYSKAMPIP